MPKKLLNKELPFFKEGQTPDPGPQTPDPDWGCTTRFEAEFWEAGYKLVAGVDEVGRGAWAGPVVAAAVILNPERIPPGLNDSKQLSAEAREALAVQIHESAWAIAIGEQDAQTVDRVNVLEATRLAMEVAITSLNPPPDCLLIDALTLSRLGLPQKGVIRGDALSVSIAAASIVAKVFRDRLMVNLESLYPDYGFARHKGYGTSLHRQALGQQGPSPVHRLTFRGVLPNPVLSFKF
ncbi:MAG: ribonuclease HII [Blastocatellia bacterium]|nr:ribonuclease HII [Blastocatellia bacterium]